MRSVVSQALYYLEEIQRIKKMIKGTGSNVLIVAY